LTIKSDDIKGRLKTYESIVRSKKIPEPGIPESFNVLTKEIMGLGFNMYMIDEAGKHTAISAYDTDDFDELDDMAYQEESNEIESAIPDREINEFSDPTDQD
jgi:DNA-directed RNA polymerase subunit beta